MEQVLKIFVFTVFYLGFVKCGVLPVDKCKLEDSSCLTPAFQTALPIFCEGIPELGTDVLDTMDLDPIAFELSGLKFTLKEGKFKGLKTSVIDTVKWDQKKKKIEVDFHFDGNVKGHYTAAGRLLILPITGDGQMKLRFKNIVVSLFIDYKMVTGEDGKKRVKPTKYDFTYDVKDNAHFNLTGLFDGNAELSNTMLLFLNENWKQVSMEFGRPMLDAAAKKIFKNIIIFFDKTPIEDIATL